MEWVLSHKTKIISCAEKWTWLELIKSRGLNGSRMRQMLHVFSHLWDLDFIQMHKISYEQIGKEKQNCPEEEMGQMWRGGGETWRGLGGGECLKYPTFSYGNGPMEASILE